MKLFFFSLEYFETFERKQITVNGKDVRKDSKKKSEIEEFFLIHQTAWLLK